MKIAVCVKVVQGRTPDVDPRTGRLGATGVPALNSLDRNAVEAAIRVRQPGQSADIVVVAATSSANLAPIREALAMGADRAVVVADPAAEGSDLLAASDLLARALQREQPDLVLLGGQSDDANGAVMPAALAERLGCPVLSQAVALTVGEQSVEVDRQTETGYETLRSALPSVVAVADGLNTARYPTMKGRTDAKRKPITLLSVSDLGLGADDVGVRGSRTVVHGLAEPPVRPPPLRIEGPDAADQLVAHLSERGFVA